MDLLQRRHRIEALEHGQQGAASRSLAITGRRTVNQQHPPRARQLSGRRQPSEAGADHHRVIALDMIAHVPKRDGTRYPAHP